LAPAIYTSRGAPSAAVSFIITSQARCDLIEIEITVRYITMTILVHSGAPEREIPLRRRRPPAVTEFGRALAVLEIKHRSAARWFHTSERNVRRWKNGARKTPPGVAVVVRLILAGKVTVADIELVAGLTPVQMNGHANLGPPAVVPEPTPTPEPSASARAQTATLVEQVCALTIQHCHWPCGDPRHVDFFFCNAPVSEPPYCPSHRRMAFLPRPLPKARPAVAYDFRPGRRLLSAADIKAPRQGDHDGVRTLTPAGAN
jgi:hypothetical protein